MNYCINCECNNCRQQRHHSFLSLPHSRWRRNAGEIRRPSSKPTKCKVTECPIPTREGKPYCPEHIESFMPRLQNLSDKIAQQKEELEAVRKHGKDAIPAKSLFLREIINNLSQEGKKTIAKLKRDTQHATAVTFPGDLIGKYVAYLEERGIVVTSKTKRGSTAVEIANKRRNPSITCPYCSFQFEEDYYYEVHVPCSEDRGD